MDRQRHVRGLRDHLGPFPFLYEDVLAEEGVTDFDQYACVPGAEPQVDEFVDHI